MILNDAENQIQINISFIIVGVVMNKLLK